MIGGKIHEIVAAGGALWVNVVDSPCGKPEYCAVYVKWTDKSEEMAVGDSLWWQGNHVYWTPFHRGDRYDIPFERVGYSGASRPGTHSTTTFGESIKQVLNSS